MPASFGTADNNSSGLRHSVCGRFRIAGFQHSDAPIDMWQSNRDGQSFAFAAFDRQFAAVLAHNPANDQKTKTSAVGSHVPRAIGAIELTEERWQFRFDNTDAGILHRYLEFLVYRHGRDGDLAARAAPS